MVHVNVLCVKASMLTPVEKKKNYLINKTTEAENLYLRGEKIGVDKLQGHTHRPLYAY